MAAKRTDKKKAASRVVTKSGGTRQGARHGVVLPAGAAGRVIPSRHVRAVLPPLVVDAAGAWVAILADWAAHGTRRAPTFARSTSVLRAVEKLLARKAAPPVDDLELEVVAAIAGTPAHFVDRWRAARLVTAVDGVLGIIERAAAGGPLRVDVMGASLRLRAHLARAADDEYAAALKAADRALGKSLGTRWRAGFLFPERPRWVNEFLDAQRPERDCYELAREYRDEDVDEVRMFLAMLTTWSEVASLADWVGKMARYHDGAFWRGGLDALFPDLAASGAADNFVDELVPELRAPALLACLPSAAAHEKLLSGTINAQVERAFSSALRAFPGQASAGLRAALRSRPTNAALKRLSALAAS